MNRVISYIGIVKKRVLFFRAFLGKGKLWMYHIRGLFCLVKFVIQSFKPYYVAFFMITTLGIYS